MAKVLSGRDGRQLEQRTVTETNAMRLMMGNAIALPFRSGCRSGISSNNVNKVFAERQQKTPKSARQTSKPATIATADHCEIKWPMVKR